MYQRKIKIQKGFKDSIQFQFKNSEQKPLTVSTENNFKFDMIDASGRELVLTKDLTILDDSVILTPSVDQTSVGTTLTFDSVSGISVGQTVQGFGIPVNTVVTNITDTTVTLNRPTVVSVTTASNITFNTLSKRGVATIELTPADTINLTAGNYKFVVKISNDDGTFTPAYSNTYYGITGDIELVEDGFPIGFPVQKVSKEQLESGAEISRDPNNMGYLFYSGWLRPFPHSITTSTAQTVTIALANFAGTITVQGTLDNSPSAQGQANAQAFDITSVTVATPTQGNIQLSWNTNVTAVRFVIVPDKDPMGINYYPTGNPIQSQINKYPNGYIDFIQYFS